MKRFLLHFEHTMDSDTLDRHCFGEAWFPVVKPTLGAQHTWLQGNTIDSQVLDLDGHREPDLYLLFTVTSSRSCLRIAGWWSHPCVGTREHARAFEVTVYLAVGKEKDRSQMLAQ